MYSFLRLSYVANFTLLFFQVVVLTSLKLIVSRDVVYGVLM